MNDRASDWILRLEAVEMQVAHQDRTIADLNEIITAQWRQIDLLERRVVELLEEVRNASGGRDAPEPPPPHY